MRNFEKREILSAIKKEQKISPELEEKLKAAITEFKRVVPSIVLTTKW